MVIDVLEIIACTSTSVRVAEKLDIQSAGAPKQRNDSYEQSRTKSRTQALVFTDPIIMTVIL